MISDFEPARAIRSFVIRGGRLTHGQRRALETLWPRYGIDFGEAVLDLDALYGRHAPRVLEIGFGNGENLLALAQRQPERDFLGIEVHPPGLGRALLALEAAGLTNVRLSAHDAVEVLARQLPRAAFDEVLILFPDPWPKKRHHKRRLIQPSFVASLAERLQPGGVLHLATDWAPYAEHMLQVLEACPELESTSAGGIRRRSPGAAGRHPVTTRFEQRGARLGHLVHELVYVRR